MRRPGRTVLPALLVGLVAACGGAVEPSSLQLSDACGTPQSQTIQGGSHLLGTTEPPVPYSSDPATSGWHSSGGGPRPGAYATAVTEPDQVAVLERGGVVVAFDPDLPATSAGALLELGASLDGDVVVTPHVRPLPTPVALTGWGWLVRCEQGVTPDDVAAFAAAVEPPGGH